MSAPDICKGCKHECEVMALLERMRMHWKRDEARLLAFGRACHAEACRIANDDPCA